jgi:hypothetical protein
LGIGRTEEARSPSAEEASAGVEAEAAALLAAKTLCNLLSTRTAGAADTGEALGGGLDEPLRLAVLRAAAAMAAAGDADRWRDESARAELPQVAALLTHLVTLRPPPPETAAMHSIAVGED